MAPLLGIRCEGTELAPGEAERLSAVEDESHPAWQALIAWWTLYEAARLSIQHRSLLVFQ